MWQRGARAVAVIGASKNAGKTTALSALLRAATATGNRVGVCSMGVDGETSDAWLATAKPQVDVERGTLVVTSAAAIAATAGRVVARQTLGFASSLGPTLLAEVRAPGAVLLCGLSHRGQLETALAALHAAGAQRIAVDGAYHRQAAADARGLDALVLAVGAVVPLTAAVATLRALTTPAAPSGPSAATALRRREITGGLTDARLHALDLADIDVLGVPSLGAILLSAVGHAALQRAGVQLVAGRTLPLLCLVSNPYDPQSATRAEPLRHLLALRDLALAHGRAVAAVDVVAGLCSDEESR